MFKKAIKNNGKLFLKFFISLVVTCILMSVLSFTVSALSASETGSPTETEILAENPDAIEGENIDSSVMKELIGIDGSQTLEIVLLITVLSIAPSILVMVTSFTRIVIVFSFLRNAMQTQSIPPNSVLTGLSLFLTVFIMWPTFTDIAENAYTPYSNGEIELSEMADRASGSLKTFMLKNTTKSNMQFFLDLSGKAVYKEETTEEQTEEQTEEENEVFTPIEPLPDLFGEKVDLNNTTEELTDFTDQLGLETVIPAFIVSELTRAFQMGFLLFIPFLVIDIVISSTLMAMGMMMLPPSMISLPFKVMLFVLVDGWQLLVGTIVSSFNV